MTGPQRRQVAQTTSVAQATSVSAEEEESVRPAEGDEDLLGSEVEERLRDCQAQVFALTGRVSTARHKQAGLSLSEYSSPSFASSNR